MMRKHLKSKIILGVVAVCLWVLTYFPCLNWAQDEHTVGLWDFNEGKGDVVADTSDNHLDGSQVSCEWADGMFNSSALRFFQNGSHVEIPHNEVLDLQVFTIEFWTKYKEPPANPAAFMSNRGWQVGNKMTGFTLRDGEGNLFIEILTKGKLHSGEAVVADDWLFIAVTYDSNSKVQFYLNGEMKKELASLGELNYAGEELWIGAEPGGGYAFGEQGADIILDEVRISDVVRTEKEIQSAMENGYAKAAVSSFQKVAFVWGNIKANR
jgi:hypothetical protein